MKLNLNWLFVVFVLALAFGFQACSSEDEGEDGEIVENAENGENELNNLEENGDLDEGGNNVDGGEEPLAEGNEAGNNLENGANGNNLAENGGNAEGGGDVLTTAAFFDFDDYSLRPDTKGELDAKLQWLNANPDAQITISGHCDERGSNQYNLALGEKRAHSVKMYLVNGGVAPNRLSIISYGEERPSDPGHSEDAWSKNRRTEFEKQ